MKNWSVLAGVAIFVTATGFGEIVTNVWTGGGDGRNWADPLNWESGAVPVSGSALLFPISARCDTSNNIPELSPVSISIRGTSPGYTPLFIIAGNTIHVDSLLDFNLNNAFATCMFPFSGSGVIRVSSDGGRQFNLDPTEQDFAGKWVFDSILVSLRDAPSLTAITGEGDEPTVPDAVTLCNGSIIKNYESTLDFPARIGFTLDETGGGFACGWGAAGSFSNVIRGPITGPGTLYLPQCAFPTILAGEGNNWAGGIEVGCNAYGWYNASPECLLRLGCDNAIPAGSSVVVNGNYAGQIDMNGFSFSPSSLTLRENGVVYNSSDVIPVLAAGSATLGGTVANNIDFTYDSCSMGIGDNSLWTNRYFTIASGETCSITNCTGVGGMAVLLNGGTLSFPATAGFSEHAYAGNVIDIDDKTIDRFTPGTLMGSSTNRTLWGINQGFYYQSMWYLPTPATYTFQKAFDDSARLDIDGSIAVSGMNVQILERKTIFLPSGWHEVRLWYANGYAGAGPGGSCTNGLLWSQGTTINLLAQKSFDLSDGTFVFVPSSSSPIYVGAGGGSLEVVPDATVAETPAPGLVLRGGIIAAEDGAGTVTLNAPTYIGNRGETVAVFDADVALGPSGALEFRNKAWIRNIPSCEFSFATNAAIYLTEDTLPLTNAVKDAGALLSVASFNQSLLSSGLIGPGVNLYIRSSSTYKGINPVEDSVSDVLTNNISLPAGSSLTFVTSGDSYYTGVLSGDGDLNVDMAGRSFTMEGDNSAFSGTMNVINGDVFVADPVSLGSSAANTVVSGGALHLGVDSGTVSIPSRVTFGNGEVIVKGAGAEVRSVVVTTANGLLNLTGTISVDLANLTLPNGLLELPATATLCVNVPEGEDWGKPLVSGAGTLVIRGGGSIDTTALSAFTGTLRLENGTLQKNITLAGSPILWLDASATDSHVTNESGDVIEWHDVRDGVSCTNHAYCYLNTTIPNYGAEGYKTALPPSLLEDAGILLPVLDFGVYKSGKWFYFSEGVPTRTVIWVLGSQNGGGGCWFGHTGSTSGILRGGNVDDMVKKEDVIYNNTSWANADFANSDTRVDGKPVNPTVTGLNGGYQILSTRLKNTAWTLNGIGKDIRTFSASNANGTGRSGGMRFGEILFFDRALSDAEITQTENYLAAKWFGKDIKSEDDTDRISGYTVEGGNTGRIHVVSHISQSIDNIAGGGVLAKIGAGTLCVEKSSVTYTGVVDLIEGGWSINGAASRYPGESLPDGLNPALWMDANAADSYGVDASGRFYWRDKRWDGMTDYIVATQRWSTAPFVLTNEIENSLSVLSFGALSTSHNRGLQWSAPVNATAIFMLIGSQESGGTILGGDDGVSVFNRYMFSKYTDPIYSSFCDGSVKNGQTRLDAVNVNGLTTGFSGGYQVLTIVPTLPVMTAQFAHDRELSSTQTRDGGQRIGEVIIFTNALTQTQVYQVEGYLMTRWARPGNVHAADRLSYLRISGETNTARFVETGARTFSVSDLSGVVPFEKRGSGEFSVNAFGAFSNTVTVKEGTLSLPIGNVFSPPPDALFWVDASCADSLTLSNGNEVVRWDDRRGNGRYAARSPTWADTVTITGITKTYTNPSPTLLSGELNGRSVVDFGVWGSGEFLNWNASIATIRTVFWVIGSQNGGGHLLDYDKSNTAVRDFWRGGFADDNWNVTSHEQFIWNATVGNAYTAVCNAPTRLNGLDVNGATTPLSGGYDLVAVRTTDNARASVFNNDRCRTYRDATGGQRLAEVIIYDRVLSDAEVMRTERYLSSKWGIPIPANDYKADTSVSMSVSLTPGATLSLCPDGETSFSAIGGVGAVTNGNLTTKGIHQLSASNENSALTFSDSLTISSNAVWTASLDSGLPAPVLVSGNVVFEEGGTFHLTDADHSTAKKVLLLRGRTINGFDASKWTVLADSPIRSYRLRQEENDILLYSSAKGTIIFLR